MIGLTVKQRECWDAIASSRRPPTFRELSNVMGCSLSNVARLVAALRERGYLDSSPGPIRLARGGGA